MELTRVVSNFNEKLFSRTLKKKRQERGMSMKQLANKLDLNKQQVARYEGIGGQYQYPKLNTFVKICEVLQIMPEELLHVERLEVKDHPEADVVYNWDMMKDRVYWDCPLCEGKNISYGDFSNKKLAVQLYRSLSFLCEHCESYFGNLYNFENEIKSIKGKEIEKISCRC